MKIHLSPTALDSEMQVILVAHLYQRHLLSSFLAFQESGLSSILTCQVPVILDMQQRHSDQNTFKNVLLHFKHDPPQDGLFFARLITFEVRVWTTDASSLLLFAFQDRLQALFLSHGSN